MSKQINTKRYVRNGDCVEDLEYEIDENGIFPSTICQCWDSDDAQLICDALNDRHERKTEERKREKKENDE